MSLPVSLLQPRVLAVSCKQPRAFGTYDNVMARGPHCCHVGVPIHEDHREAFSNLGLMQQHVSSSDPQWVSPTTPGGSHTPRKRVLRQQNSTFSTDGLSDVALSDGESPSGARVHANGHVSPAGLPLAGQYHSNVAFECVCMVSYSKRCMYPNQGDIQSQLARQTCVEQC